MVQVADAVNGDWCDFCGSSREEKQADNTLFTLQAYLIGTVNTIQSIQCSKTQAWPTEWNTNEKVQKHTIW